VGSSFLPSGADNLTIPYPRVIIIGVWGYAVNHVTPAMKAMTSRERLLAALRREPVDYVPCCVTFNPLRPVQPRGHKWQFPWAPEASEEEKLRYQVCELGLAQVVAVSVNFCRATPGVESKVWVEEEVLHKTYTTMLDEWRRLR